MHMGRGSLTILDGQFRLRQHCAVVFQFLHPVDLFGWKDAFNAKVLRRQTKFSVTKWQERIETLQDMWFTRWPSLQTMTNSPVAGSTIWNARITLLRLWKNTFGNCVWVRYQSNDAQSQTKCLVHFETTCCIWETFTVKNVPTTNHIFSYICRWSQKRYMYHVFYVRIESCDLVHFICYP